MTERIDQVVAPLDGIVEVFTQRQSLGWQLDSMRYVIPARHGSDVVLVFRKPAPAPTAPAIIYAPGPRVGNPTTTKTRRNSIGF